MGPEKPEQPACKLPPGQSRRKPPRPTCMSWARSSGGWSNSIEFEAIQPISMISSGKADALTESITAKRIIMKCEKHASQNGVEETTQDSPVLWPNLNPRYNRTRQFTQWGICLLSFGLLALPAASEQGE